MIKKCKVGLYTGDCMLNTYFMALAGVENLERFDLIKRALEQIDENLMGDFIVNSADNIKFSKKLTKHYQSQRSKFKKNDLKKSFNQS